MKEKENQNITRKMRGNISWEMNIFNASLIGRIFKFEIARPAMIERKSLVLTHAWFEFGEFEITQKVKEALWWLSKIWSFYQKE